MIVQTRIYILKGKFRLAKQRVSDKLSELENRTRSQKCGRRNNGERQGRVCGHMECWWKKPVK